MAPNLFSTYLAKELKTSLHQMKAYTKAALVADALNLGPHWIYNQSKIGRMYPDGVTTFTDPASNYHPNRKAGQFTHIGDQLHDLSKSIEENQNRYDLDHWRNSWLAHMSQYDGYLDGATKATLATKALSPSDSDEISGATRLAPLLDLDLSLEDTIAAAKSQASLTHGALEVSELAEFLVRSVFAIRAGANFHDAFQKAAQDGSYTKLSPETYLEKALAADPADHLKASSSFGLTCHFPDAFPLTLYYALHFGESYQSCLSLNALAGGDTTARALALSSFFVARDGDVGADLSPQLNLPSNEAAPFTLKPGPNSISFAGSLGQLAGVLELPEGETTATAVFAHCFTCGKDFLPEKRITQALAKRGIATLRIDFAGLGKSEGAFSDSSFLTNLDDLQSAAQWLGDKLIAPSLLVGHSLGGSAVLAAAKSIPSIKAVATIGAPADPHHVTHLFENHLDDIKENGQAEVKLAGRSLTIGKRFLDDLTTHNQQDILKQFKGTDILVMHSPEDDIVPLKNAGVIYSALPHPKSFISLAGADHLLTKPADAEYVADLITTWSARALRS